MMDGWKDHEPSPIEFLHDQLLKEFHKFRRSKTEGINVEINGRDLTTMIANAKRTTYEKYKVLELDKAILKSVLASKKQKSNELQSKTKKGNGSN